MSISITTGVTIPVSVVEVGSEITQDQLNAITAATLPSVSNVFITQSLLTSSLTPYALLASPTFTGTPTLPTGTIGVTQTSTDNSTKLSTTAFVKAQSYLTTSSASSTYQTISGMSSYLTTSSASTTYAPKASPTFTGTVTIPSGASISGYLTTATASSTYQTQAGMSSYLTTSTASSTYQTQAGMSSYAPKASPSFTGIVDIPSGANIVGYATQSYVTSQGYLTDAPSNGNEYVRKNAAWAIATGGGGGGITTADVSFWLTQNASYLQPTGIATGYVLSYNGTNLVWIAPSGGGGAVAISAYDNGITYTVGQQVIFSNRFWYMSTSVGAAGYDPVGHPSYWTEISPSIATTLSVTNIDLTGNFNGYSMGSGYYSFKYDSSANTLRMQDGAGSGVTVSATGITFPDSTTLTTSPSAFVDAPSDGNFYVRKDGAWHQCQIASVYDSTTMTNQNVLRT